MNNNNEIKGIRELTDSIIDIDNSLKDYEQIEIIKRYKALLLRKEYLLCEYTYAITHYNYNKVEDKLMSNNKNKR